jgi:hypothetical protein
MHCTGSGALSVLCYLCHFTPFSRLVDVSYQQLFLVTPGLPELFANAQERLSASPEGVKLLTWPFTSPESAVTTGALQSLSPPAAAISRLMGAAPPAATNRLGALHP